MCLNKITVILLVCSLFSAGQLSGNFVANEISDELKNNARSVVRYHEQTLEVQTISDAKLSVRYAITVLNKNGLEDSFLQVGYNKNIKVRNIVGEIFDASGKRIKRLSISDVEDFSAIDGFSIYDDSRVKYYDPEIREYPFTVEYSYDLNFNGYVSLPGWSPFFGSNVSVEKSSFFLIYPSDLRLRYEENNIAKKNEELFDDQIKIKWEMEGVEAIEYEPFMPPYKDWGESVAIAPDQFKYEGYSGGADSWFNLGVWAHQLSEGRGELSESTVQEMRELIVGASSEKEKIERIYNYLQENTRYVSIQLGIGGFQPFEAETVERLKYGDCKALTNYMKALLAAVDVQSFYTLVLAGDYEPNVSEKFPSNNFNHVFLCAPLEKDTLWLECTSQNIPCGYIGDFTDDRNVLLVGEDGGQLVRTPAYSASSNGIRSNSNVDIYANGNAKIKAVNRFYGSYLDQIVYRMSLDDVSKERGIYERIDVPKLRVNDFNYSIDKQHKMGTERLDLDVANLAVKMGSNLFLTPNMFNRVEELSGDPQKRLTDIFIRRSSSQSDTIKFHLPSGVEVSTIPDNITIDSEFGLYKMELALEGQTLSYYRYFELKKGTYLKSRANEFYVFFNQIKKADKLRIALKVN